MVVGDVEARDGVHRRELELGAELQLRVEADGRVDDVLVTDRRQATLKSERKAQITFMYSVVCSNYRVTNRSQTWVGLT